MYKNGEYDKALVYFKNILKKELKPVMNQKSFSANVYNKIGMVLKEILNPTVDQKSFSANVYHIIGKVYRAKGAFEYIQKALKRPRVHLLDLIQRLQPFVRMKARGLHRAKTVQRPSWKYLHLAHHQT